MRIPDPLWGLAVVALLGLLWIVRRMLRRRPAESISAALDTPGSQIRLADIPQAPSRLVLGTDSEPIVELFRMPLGITPLGTSVSLSPALATSLWPLVQQAPNLAMNAARAAQNVFVMKFAPEIAEGLANGSVTIMRSLEGGYRASAVSGGQIVGNASLFTAHGVKVASAATAVWQVLAIVTAQKFLADIDKRLALVEGSLNEIRAFQTADYFASVFANVEYLKSIAGTLASQRLTEPEVTVFLNQLEEIERDCGRITFGFRDKLERVASGLESQRLEGRGLEHNASQARQSLVDYDRCSQGQLLGIHIRTIAAQLRCALPVGRGVSIGRLQSLKRELVAHLLKRRAFRKLARKRLPTLRSLWSFESTSRRHQNDLETLMKSSSGVLRDMSAGIARALRSGERVASAQQAQLGRPVLMAVTLGADGLPQQVLRLETADADEIEIAASR